MQSIHKVNNKQQDKHIEAQVWGEASDKTPVYAADVIVTYQVLPEKSASLQRTGLAGGFRPVLKQKPDDRAYIVNEISTIVW